MVTEAPEPFDGSNSELQTLDEQRKKLEATLTRTTNYKEHSKFLLSIADNLVEELRPRLAWSPYNNEWSSKYRYRDFIYRTRWGRVSKEIIVLLVTSYVRLALTNQHWFRAADFEKFKFFVLAYLQVNLCKEAYAMERGDLRIEISEQETYAYALGIELCK